MLVVVVVLIVVRRQEAAFLLTNDADLEMVQPPPPPPPPPRTLINDFLLLHLVRGMLLLAPWYKFKIQLVVRSEGLRCHLITAPDNRYLASTGLCSLRSSLGEMFLFQFQREFSNKSGSELCGNKMNVRN